MFRDECSLELIAGKGGDGLVSFRREKYAPRGGPDGGDGGKGGSIVLRATTGVSSLLSIARKPRYKARSGEPGGPNQRSGHAASDVILEVPVGTQVIDAERGHVLRDLASDGLELEICRGGKGGRGNMNFATPVHQTPRYAEPGRPGERRTVRLELKIMAEAGLVGLPNAGKSTFLSAVSRARPKIADYPFTTLEPHVGIAAVGDHDTLVIADLPGLIEGAAAGAGLGHRFLKHVERCRVLLHLVDCSNPDEDPATAFGVIEAELARYSSELAARPRIVVATKVEGDEAHARADALEAALGVTVRRISSVRHDGLGELLEATRQAVRGVVAEPWA
ncbi:MAG: GTPase ObgE [Planctomycetota bacterium]